jgi:NADPH:quinone reductase
MALVIRLHRTGGPEVLRLENVDLPPPGPGEARVRHTAIGVNFIETYQRSGLYTLPLPTSLGTEAAGVVVSVGPGVTHVAPGDRVAYCGGPPGAYADERNIPASWLVELPASIDDRTAAAVMLKGLTAWYLLRITRPCTRGETILLHAAAGGVGLLFCQWARHLGVRVLGTVGSPEKAELARAHGCVETILYRSEDVVRRVRDLTAGAGVPVDYDSVGTDTFAASLDCLAPFGMLVLFGQSSGPVPPFDLRVLADKGSLYVTRPTLRHHTSFRDRLLAGTSELFSLITSGVIRTHIDRAIPLAQTGEAHRLIESRATSGQVLLVP